GRGPGQQASGEPAALQALGDISAAHPARETEAGLATVSITEGQLRGVRIGPAGAIFRGIPGRRLLDAQMLLRTSALEDQSFLFLQATDPNGPGLPAWPAYADDAAYLALTANGPIAHHKLRSQICALLDRP
ncbi:MAG TPA: hypothetical protein VN719_14260, partial [Gemmatimonadales bacterium]|nr:hypothetical protein [Gemmatimonadales bacterium]